MNILHFRAVKIPETVISCRFFNLDDEGVAGGVAADARVEVGEVRSRVGAEGVTGQRRILDAFDAHFSFPSLLIKFSALLCFDAVREGEVSHFRSMTLRFAP